MDTATESYWFRILPDGSIIKAIRTTGKIDEAGNPIRGSAINIDLEPKEAKRLLKRELDFWLKGIGLKKKPAGQAASDKPEVK